MNQNHNKNLNRRAFLNTAAGTGLGLAAYSTAAQSNADVLPPNLAEAAPSELATGPALRGSPVVTGPAPESMCIIQPLRRRATGYLEYAIDDAPLQKLESEEIGLMPLETHALKFKLPPLPPGKKIRYRVTARTIHWKPAREWTFGESLSGEPETDGEHTFRTLDPNADRTTFVVWNDTHERLDTMRGLHSVTVPLKPDFLLWNGDQVNHLDDVNELAGHYLAPDKLPIARDYPLAYVRGNHDMRGPEARQLPNFTGTPEDRFFYSFRSGPLATIVLDTGEDCLDDLPEMLGLLNYTRHLERQTAWLEKAIEEKSFKEAPFRVLFCHIPLWRRRASRKEYATRCREAWGGLLQKAGVKVVISGHTHAPDWLPQSETQPIGQMIGGGPLYKTVTYLHGTATRETLKLKTIKLDGTVLHDVTLKV